jgi:hypothetical protein
VPRMHPHNAGPNAIKLADASESASTWMRCAGSDPISSLTFGVSSTASRHWFIPLSHNIVVPSAEDWMCQWLGVNLSRSTHARLSVHIHTNILRWAHTVIRHFGLPQSRAGTGTVQSLFLPCSLPFVCADPPPVLVFNPIFNSCPILSLPHIV